MTEIDTTQAQVQNQAEMIGEEIQGALERSQAIEDVVTTTLREKRTFNKTVDEWHRELTVRIDPAADPAKVMKYCSQLALSLDTAYKNLSTTKVLYSNYKLSYNSALNDRITAQANNRSRKVVPALETMERVAQGELGDRALTSAQYETFIEFWQNMVFKLKDLVELTKTMAMCNGTRYKVGEY